MLCYRVRDCRCRRAKARESDIDDNDEEEDKKTSSGAVKGRAKNAERGPASSKNEKHGGPLRTVEGRSKAPSKGKERVATINSEEQAAGDNGGTDRHRPGKRERHAPNPSASVSKKRCSEASQTAPGPSKVRIVLVSGTTRANGALII